MAFTAPAAVSSTQKLGLWNFTDTQCHLPNTPLTGHSCFSFISYTGLRKEFTFPNLNRFCRHRRKSIRNYSAVKSIVASSAVKSIKVLPFRVYINRHGKIQPIRDPDTAASVFAIFDKDKNVQYIGFSRDLKNTLRILMGRRPELCHFYKSYNLNSVNKPVMLAVREQWLSELGSIPPGNSIPEEKLLWEQPVVVNSISESGKAAAAASKAKELQNIMLARGLKEEMIYDPALLEQGKCDILPVKPQAAEELARVAPAKATEHLKTNKVSVPVASGGAIEYEIRYEMKFKTNGGWIYDVLVNYNDEETRHRIICDSFYPEAVGMREDDFLEVVVGFLLHKKIPRHTEGVLRTLEFNINYFSIGEVAQRFEDLQEWFEKELPDDHWRFRKVHSHGAHIDPAPPVGPLEWEFV